jgi:hypothetical protein
MHLPSPSISRMALCQRKPWGFRSRFNACVRTVYNESTVQNYHKNRWAGLSLYFLYRISFRIYISLNEIGTVCTIVVLSGVSFLFRLYQLYSINIYIYGHILFTKVRSVCILVVTVAAVWRRLLSLDRVSWTYLWRMRSLRRHRGVQNPLVSVQGETVPFAALSLHLVCFL